MLAMMTFSVLLSTVVGTIVGLKLLLLASRTRRFPECAVGAALFAYAAVAQTSLFAGHALGPDGDSSLRILLLGLRLFAYFVTLLGLSVFTWRVFGIGSRWRQILIGFIASTAILTLGATFRASVQLIGSEVQLPLYARFGSSPQYILVFAWMCIESLRYYRLMRKRETLGLADPIVSNRFAVWGMAAGASCVLLVALLYVSLTHDTMLGDDPLSSGIISAAGLVNTIGWWLTFMPPGSYLRWLKKQTVVVDAGRG